MNREFQKAILEALGLWGRPIRRIILEMEVNEPVQLRIDEYAEFEDGKPYLIAKVFELATFDHTELNGTKVTIGAALPSESEATKPNNED